MFDPVRRNELLTEICELLLLEDVPEDAVETIANDLPGEYENMRQEKAEAAWEERSEPDDTAYRRDMRAAGRGHLLK